MTSYAFRAVVYFWHSFGKRHACKKKMKKKSGGGKRGARHNLHAAVQLELCGNPAAIPGCGRTVALRGLTVLCPL